MAIHGHGGSTAVAITRGVGDAWAHCQYASAGCSDSQTMVGAHTPALCSWSRDACWWSSHSWACRGALTCTWTPRRATKRRCSRVSLGGVSGGWQHTPELRCLVFGLHGVLHCSRHLDCTSPVVHGLHPGGLGHPAPDDRFRRVRGYCARDPILWRGLPPRWGCPQEGRQDGAVAGKPRPEAGNTLAGRRPLLEGSFPFDPAVHRVQVAQVVVP